MAIDAKWRLCVLTLGGLRGPEHDQRGPWPFSERQVSSGLQGRAGRRTPSACCYRTSYFTSLKMYYEIGHVIIYSLKTDNKMNVHSTNSRNLEFRVCLSPSRPPPWAPEAAIVVDFVFTLCFLFPHLPCIHTQTIRCLVLPIFELYINGLMLCLFSFVLLLSPTYFKGTSMFIGGVHSYSSLLLFYLSSLGFSTVSIFLSPSMSIFQQL